jgi:1-acyl-sn-glycerol-3-phosphate acyltransferase/nucleoside-diphosphate-sugar epimerase
MSDWGQKVARVLVIERREELARVLIQRLGSDAAVLSAPRTETELVDKLRLPRIDTVIYAPSAACSGGGTQDLTRAETFCRACAQAEIGHLIVLSSAAVYGPNPHNPGLIGEVRLTARHRQNAIAAAWVKLEELAQSCFGCRAGARLTILRVATLPLRDEPGPLGGLFHRRWSLPFVGFDPSIQLLSPEDLAEAVQRAVVASNGGVFNIAPAGVIPLREALRMTGVRRFPLPYCARRAFARLRGVQAADRLEYLHYSWTISGRKAECELGFVPTYSSSETILNSRATHSTCVAPTFDDYGFDPNYFARLDATLARFLGSYYWRAETRGLDRIPSSGPAVLVGIHRGFMPFDGFITCHQTARVLGRIPRFLIHPGLVKFPFLHDFMTKQGAMIACGENADYVLKRQELLALYPEGINGAFRMYRDAYRLGKFGRDEYVRMALRNRAPIIPFVTVGSAEIFPILGKIEWAWWKRYAEWPFIPITPTFPLLPLPLPSKWHTQFLEPVEFQREYPPDAAEDEEVVRKLSERVRARMGETLAWMLNRRRSVFFGSIFDEVRVESPDGIDSGRPVFQTGQAGLKIRPTVWST